MISFVSKLFQVLRPKATFALDFGWVNCERWAQVSPFMRMGAMLSRGRAADFQSSLPALCLICTGENLFREGILLHLIPFSQSVPRGYWQAGAAQADTALGSFANCLCHEVFSRRNQGIARGRVDTKLSQREVKNKYSCKSPWVLLG